MRLITLEQKVKPIYLFGLSRIEETKRSLFRGTVALLVSRFGTVTDGVLCPTFVADVPATEATAGFAGTKCPTSPRGKCVTKRIAV